MNDDCILLSRGIRDWEWLSDPNTLALYIVLLLKASPKDDTRWRGILLQRGELITSLSQLSELAGLSVQKTRTVLKHLLLSEDIEIHTTSKGSRIRVLSYDKFVGSEADE